ncbi:uncharacterized protein LOC113522587 [Galleria mellonella]|uniref:Uncharacterized protein LOC113522587 n=1 Tax=Galleria mellonella TaxID=7137 RepID=A0A6J3C961_GALME|nr:uncharacterized protein LOC113522587 [Galleria mellonella]
MPFTRHLDASFPRVWDRWEADGTSWTIEDLPPGDEDEALDILLKYQCPEEILLVLNNMLGDPVSLETLCQVFRYFFQQRLTLACYAQSGGDKKLVALNVCGVKIKGEELNFESKADNFINLLQTSLYLDAKANSLEYLDIDKALIAVGLVVRKEYRGAGLGCKLLAARMPLCRFLGIKGTATTFTSIPAQKSAARCGFTTILELTIRELSEAGFNYPKDDNRILKVMVNKYE